MRRRAFLAGVFAGSVTLSGCQGPEQAGGQGTVDSMAWRGESTPGPARPAIQSSFEFDPAREDPVGVVEVGSPTTAIRREDRYPWSVVVWNDADRERTVDVSVVGESLGRAFDGELTLPAGGWYRFRLLEPDRYAIGVRTPDRPRYEFQVPYTGFDCNRHTVRLRVTSTGLLEYVTLSDMVDCGSWPTPRGEDWTPGGTDSE